MNNATEQTIYFYSQHPISCEIILSKLRAGRGHLDGLRPEELSVHDQDHYGGLAATDALAQSALIDKGLAFPISARAWAERCGILLTNMTPMSPGSN